MPALRHPMMRFFLPVLSVLCALSLPGMACAENSFRVGVEGFRDNYKEDSVGLNDNANMGSFTADYIHSANGYFTSVQTRGSYGKDDYKSISGTLNGIPQYEGELRVISGVSIPIKAIGGVHAIVPYIGLGSRFFYGNGKNLQTNLGKLGYDRRIAQFYIPVGVSWEFTHGDLTFWPNFEVDPMFYGRVNSRLSNINYAVPANEAEFDITNQQRKGFGLRGEMMVGQKLESLNWQVGPFVRYWSVKDSELKYDAGGSVPGYVLEPENTRLQAGAALRVQF